MYSVTNRVDMIKQPRGGYLKCGLFVKEEYSDDVVLNKNENIEASIVGMAVDYLTRYMSCAKCADCFGISLMGARLLDLHNNSKHKEIDKAYSYIDMINSLDDKSIVNTCKLVGYDVCCRASCDDYRSKGLEPDEFTISNIRNMVNRALLFFEREGGITETNITFEGGYTDIISSGDADYLTSNGLWDMKATKYELNANYTLQLLIYYLLGLRSNNDKFNTVEKIGFFNPRRNICYWVDTSFIPESVISIVSREVIGIDIL